MGSKGGSKAEKEASLDNFSQNYDALVKNSFHVLKDDVAEFLGIQASSLEETSTTAAWAEIVHLSGDVAFAAVTKTKSQRLGLDIEMEANVSMDDLYRFCCYNSIYAHKYKCGFQTFIITAEKPSAEKYKTPSVAFEPTIIRLDQKDGGKARQEMLDKANKGERINKLELIWRPLTGGAGSALDKTLDALKIIDLSEQDEEIRRLLASWVILGVNKKLDKKEKAVVRKEAEKTSLITRESLLEWADEELQEKYEEIQKALAEKDNALAEKDIAIAEKDNAIAEKDNAIAENDNAIAEKDKFRIEAIIAMSQDKNMLETFKKNTGIYLDDYLTKA
jgi:hypothetical protein